MKRSLLPLAFALLATLPLTAGDGLLYQPEFGRFDERARENFVFPYPLDLSDSYLTFSYLSDTSCRLTLRGKTEVETAELPPLDGRRPYSTRVTPAYRPSFPLFSVSLRDSRGKPVPFSLFLTQKKDYTDQAQTASHERILSSEYPDEKEYLLYRWDRGNNILIFDFRDYEVQDRYLKRLAFFMEKPGYRGTLMTNEEMEGLHGWNAHDYSREGLASFYNLANESDFTLNDEEYELRQILLTQGILSFNGSEYTVGEGAIVSITRESSPVLRQRFITHETLHGLFFTDEDLRESIRRYWLGMPEDYREIWRFFMKNNFYDPRDEVLMYNEMLGYTLQLSRKEVAGYFVWRFNRIAELHPEDAPFIERISPYLPDVMLGIYDQLEYIVSRHYPYSNGSFQEEGTAEQQS